MSLSGKELEPGYIPNINDVITVREGLNVTLFCVMEGAPPPVVTTFKSRSAVPSEQYRHISDSDLGT